MVYLFCIRHIMDGCIIFFMLDSQAAKYFNKISKKKLVWFGEYWLILLIRKTIIF